MATKLPAKQAAQAEAAITRAVANALHWLGALKGAARHLSPDSLHAVAALLLKLYPLRQPLLTRHASDVLAQACGGHMAATTLAELLRAVVTQVRPLPRPVCWCAFARPLRDANQHVNQPMRLAGDPKHLPINACLRVGFGAPDAQCYR